MSNRLVFVMPTIYTSRETDCQLDVLRAIKGAHVEVYWCVVKKNSWVTFWKKKSLYSTYSSFLVINVCNQGKNLCSPCIFSEVGSGFLCAESALTIIQHSKKELPQRSGKPARAIFRVSRLYLGGGLFRGRKWIWQQAGYERKHVSQCHWAASGFVTNQWWHFVIKETKFRIP